MNKNTYTAYKNEQNSAKAMLREKFIAVKANIKKDKIS